MNTQWHIEAQFGVPQEEKNPGDKVITPAPGREDTNSVEQDLGLQARFAEGKSIEDWKIERLENFVCLPKPIFL